MSSKPQTVPEYIKAALPVAQKKMNDMRRVIRVAAPGAKESIKWSMPAISYRRILVMYAAFKNHISLFPTSSAVKKFSKELSKYNHAKGSIQFPLDKPLPLALIRRIVKFRVKESIEKDGRWKS